MKNNEESNNSLPFAFVIVFVLIIVGAVYLFTSIRGGIPSDNVGSDIGATRFVKANVSSAISVTTSSTLVLATTSSAQYREITNLSGAAIYCSLDNGKVAVQYTGITILASSSYIMAPDKENMYVGAVRCIAPSGTASTTAFERI